MEDFLRSRHCDVDKLKEEKIDESCIELMTDEQLTKYIPLYGDRIALRAFLKTKNCKRKQQERKRSLFERLRYKLKRAASPDPEDAPSKPQSRNAVKPNKTLGIGLMKFDKKKGSYVQVRTKSGGGTRTITVPKHSTKTDLINEAKKVFFPEGKSAKFGGEDQYEFNMMDYQFITLDDGVTVQEVSEITKLNNLRFYLAITKRYEESDSEDSAEKDTELPTLNIGTKKTSPKMLTRRTVEDRPSTSTKAPSNESSTNIGIDTDENTKKLLTTETVEDRQSTSTKVSSNESATNIDIYSQAVINDQQLDNDSLPDIDPVDDFLSSLEKRLAPVDPPKSHTIRVHRGHVFLELKQKFKNNPEYALEKDIFTFQMILPNGELEIAEDNGGVVRDALAEFWDSFYEQCCLGRDFKVPFIRHDYDSADWQAIASVLYLGWKCQNYFPISIAKSFMSCCLYGMDIYDTSKDCLIPEYLAFIPCTEADTFKSAMEGELDVDDVIDVLGSHECRVLPTKENIKTLIGEIAHKELIQQPMYVKASWFDRLTLLGFSLGDVSLDSVYQSLQPDPRKVVKLLNLPKDMNAQQIATADFLKKYIRELERDSLAHFLRFCTGSDLCLCDNDGSIKTISVRFSTVSGLGRRPVAHTCGRVLELPEQYDNYLDFRTEFNTILKSDIWVMDFV